MLTHPSTVPRCSLPWSSCIHPYAFWGSQLHCAGTGFGSRLNFLTKSYALAGTDFSQGVFFPPQSYMSHFPGCCWISASPCMPCCGPWGTCSLSAARASKSHWVKQPTGKESGPEVLAENPTTTKTQGEKKRQALNQGRAVIRSFYIPGGWPISFYCPHFFSFFFNNANPIHFLEPPICYLFTRVEGSLWVLLEGPHPCTGAPQGPEPPASEAPRALHSAASPPLCPWH